MIRKSEYDRLLRDTYFRGGRAGCSTSEPQKAAVPPVGAWMVDDTFVGRDGREVLQLVELPVGNIEISEDTGREKRASLLQYTRWLLEGREAPPICVLQTDVGVLKTLDHRRLLAAKIAGRPTIKAWVSWTTTSPRPGNPSVGLTLELARAGRQPLPTRAARPEYTLFAGDRKMAEEIGAQLDEEGALPCGRTWPWRKRATARDEASLGDDWLRPIPCGAHAPG